MVYVLARKEIRTEGFLCTTKVYNDNKSIDQRTSQYNDKLNSAVSNNSQWHQDIINLHID